MSSIADFFATESDLRSLLDRFDAARVAIVGDFFLDRYLVVDPALGEPSVETGLVAHQVVEIRNSPGAAGTVVNNLAALGAGRIHCVGVVGEDGQGYDLVRELAKRGADATHLLEAPGRFTPTYTKPTLRRPGQAEEEMSRLDIHNRTPTPVEVANRIVDAIRRLAQEVDAFGLVDQVHLADCGVLTSSVRDHIASLASENPRVHWLADSRAHIGMFRNVSIKPNSSETLRATGGTSDDLDQLKEAAVALAAKIGRTAFVTAGPAGILVADRGAATLVPGFPVSGPIDVTGAGDSASAAILLSLSAGAAPLQAACVANLVASITVQQLGTTGTASREQVLARYREVG